VAHHRIGAACFALLLSGCGGSTMVADDANEPQHQVRTIATSPSGYDTADAIAKALEAREDFEPKVLDVDQTMQLLRRLGIKSSKAQLSENRQRLRAEGVDGWLDVTTHEHPTSDAPNRVSVRLSSTHDPTRAITLEWSNAWGGMKGSLADASMRKGLEAAAREIAAGIAKQFNE